MKAELRRQSRWFLLCLCMGTCYITTLLPVYSNSTSVSVKSIRNKRKVIGNCSARYMCRLAILTQQAQGRSGRTTAMQWPISYSSELTDRQDTKPARCIHHSKLIMLHLRLQEKKDCPANTCQRYAYLDHNYQNLTHYNAFKSYLWERQFLLPAFTAITEPGLTGSLRPIYSRRTVNLRQKKTFHQK